ncbi:unnamed protein product [Arctogadus glacialis]
MATRGPPDQLAKLYTPCSLPSVCVHRLLHREERPQQVPKRMVLQIATKGHPHQLAELYTPCSLPSVCLHRLLHQE